MQTLCLLRAVYLIFCKRIDIAGDSPFEFVQYSVLEQYIQVCGVVIIDRTAAIIIELPRNDVSENRICGSMICVD